LTLVVTAFSITTDISAPLLCVLARCLDLLISLHHTADKKQINSPKTFPPPAR
jgi:hypothetical protein